MATMVGSDNEVIKVGDKVVWEGHDYKVPKRAIGRVLGSDARGRAIVEFDLEAKKGVKETSVKKHIAAGHIRRLQAFKVGDEVIWPDSDPVIPSGAIGKVVRFDRQHNAVVTFKGVRRHVHPAELQHLPKLAVGDSVVWEGAKRSSDIPAGTLGVIARFDAKGEAVVRFAGGAKYHVGPAELRRPPKLSIGSEVVWPTSSSSDLKGAGSVPRGSVGQITRFDSKGSAVVKFRGGKKFHVPSGQLMPAAKLTIGDEVVWDGDDSQTPRGTIGKIMRFDAAGQASVRFGKGSRRRLPLGELSRPLVDDGHSHTLHSLRGSHGGRGGGGGGRSGKGKGKGSAKDH